MTKFWKKFWSFPLLWALEIVAELKITRFTCCFNAFKSSCTSTIWTLYADRNSWSILEDTSDSLVDRSPIRWLRSLYLSLTILMPFPFPLILSLAIADDSVELISMVRYSSRSLQKRWCLKVESRRAFSNELQNRMQQLQHLLSVVKWSDRGKRY